MVDESVNLGVFQLLPQEESMVKFSQRCSHAVEATSSTDKDEIEVSLERGEKTQRKFHEKILLVRIFVNKIH